MPADSYTISPEMCALVDSATKLLDARQRDALVAIAEYNAVASLINTAMPARAVVRLHLAVGD